MLAYTERHTPCDAKRYVYRYRVKVCFGFVVYAKVNGTQFSIFKAILSKYINLNYTTAK